MPYDVEDFQVEVIERSRETPVLVDFWAPWCGPCRVLGPVLESLARESNGRWRLAKVNTDIQPDVAQFYQVRGIPSVKLFVDGEVADEFTGALPEYAVKQWLEKALPSENRQRIDQAEREIDAGDETAAKRLLEVVLSEEPAEPRARVLMARLLVFDDPGRALDLIAGGVFAGPAFVQMEEGVKTVAGLLERNPDVLPEGAGQDAYASAVDALKERRFDAAIEHFIEVLQIDRYYDDDGARKACVALFTLLGPEHPATKRYRRTFDMALY